MDPVIIVSALFVAVISSLTALLAYFRGEYLLDGGAGSGASALELRRKAVYGFVALAVLLGISASALYLLLLGVLPFTARSVFQNIGLAVTLILGLLVVAFRWKQGFARIAAMLLLAILWGLGYGYLLPQMLSSAR